MPREARSEDERHAAVWTREPPHALVAQLVVVQRARVREPLVANVAPLCETPPLSVDLHVRLIMKYSRRRPHLRHVVLRRRRLPLRRRRYRYRRVGRHGRRRLAEGRHRYREGVHVGDVAVVVVRDAKVVHACVGGARASADVEEGGSGAIFRYINDQHFGLAD